MRYNSIQTNIMRQGNTYRRHSAFKALMLTAALAVVALMGACTSEVDDYFDKPASQRLSEAMDKTRQVLRSAEYGWEFEYYPGSSLEYGGVVYTVRFDSLTATVGCSLVPDSTVTSYYKITNDNGPVLSFDTYNSLLHYFSTPSSSEYEAKGGEFEFVVDSVGTDLIRLYGKKTHNTMYLRRLTTSPDDYARRTVNIYDHFVDSIHGLVGNAELQIAVDPVGRTLNCVSGRDTFNISFAYYDEGIRFYRPIRLGGVTLHTLRYNVETAAFIAADNDDVQLQGVPFQSDRMNFPLYEGDYTLRYDGKTMPVHLAPNRLEGTYLLQGLCPKYDLVLRYNQETGDLTLGSQIVGTQEGMTVYWVCYDYTGGYLGLQDEGQFTISWNKNRFYPTFNFRATNPNTLNCDGGLLIYLFYTEDGELAANVLDDEAWMTNGSGLFRSIVSLNRRTRLDF